MTKCVVKFCKCDNQSSCNNVSFHHFPLDSEMRQKWIHIISDSNGDQNFEPNSLSIICSRHFLEADMSISRNMKSRGLRKTAIPMLELQCNIETLDVDICRFCLATDVKMYSLLVEPLKYCMDYITKILEPQIVGLPQFVCYECRAHLLKIYKIIENCRITQDTLLDIYTENGQVTKSLITSINRKKIKLQSAYSKSTTLIISISSIQENNFVCKLENVKNQILDNLEKDPLSKPNLSRDSSVDTSNRERHEPFVKIETNYVESDLASEDENERLSRNPNDIVKFEPLKKPDLQFDNSNDGHNDTDDYALKSTTSRVNKKSESNYPNVKRKGNTMNTKLRNEKLKLSKKNISENPQKTQLKNEAAVESLSKYYRIVDLSLQEQIEQWEKQVESGEMLRDAYKCNVCFKSIQNQKTLKRHLSFHSPSRGEYSCPVCKLRFRMEARLGVHALRVHSKRYECKHCPKVWYNYVSAKQHSDRHAGNVHACTQCAFKSRSQSGVSEHARARHACHTHCVYCGRGCSGARGLAQHYARAHAGQNDVPKETFRCEPCNVAFYNEKALDYHMASAKQHNNQNTLHACKLCDATNMTRPDFVYHMRYEHGEKLPSIIKRKRCVNRKLSTEYPKPCEHCGVVLESRFKHYHHVKRVHPTCRHTYQCIVKYICDKCGKGFPNATLLRYHEARHGSPKYACSECPARFFYRFALRNHKYRHTPDAKPHRCKLCDVTFTLKNNLDRHVRSLHLKETPFACKHCDRKFRHWVTMDQHIKHTHLGIPRPPRKKPTVSEKQGVSETLYKK